MLVRKLMLGLLPGLALLMGPSHDFGPADAHAAYANGAAPRHLHHHHRKPMLAARRPDGASPIPDVFVSGGDNFVGPHHYIHTYCPEHISAPYAATAGGFWYDNTGRQRNCF